MGRIVSQCEQSCKAAQPRRFTAKTRSSAHPPTIQDHHTPYHHDYMMKSVCARCASSARSSHVGFISVHGGCCGVPETDSGQPRSLRLYRFAISCTLRASSTTSLGTYQSRSSVRVQSQSRQQQQPISFGPFGRLTIAPETAGRLRVRACAALTLFADGEVSEMTTRSSDGTTIPAR